MIHIVCQSSDPEFAEILSRIREGEHTDDDVSKIKDLAYTDTSNWPDQYVKLYLTNYLAGQENESCIEKLNSKVFVIKSEDSARDFDTGTYSISLPKTASLNQTGNLPSQLKVCVGARLMLTDNVSIADKLINGSIGTIKKLHFNPNYPLRGVIYVKFDDPNAGNLLKNNRLPGELKDCVPISPVVKTFPFSKGNSLVTVQRKQYPGILGHAITVHKSQGSTLTYMKGDLDRRTEKRSTLGKQYQAPICQGQLYTLLSRAKCRDNLQLLNFEPDQIKVNLAALEEMHRMRKEALFE